MTEHDMESIKFMLWSAAVIAALVWFMSVMRPTSGEQALDAVPAHQGEQ